jgi:hypothetical protein
MTLEEIALFIESTLASEHDTIVKVYYGKRSYYGSFVAGEDYDLLKSLNKFRFVPNESSSHIKEEKPVSIILNGADIAKVELKTFIYAR